MAGRSLGHERCCWGRDAGGESPGAVWEDKSQAVPNLFIPGDGEQLRLPWMGCLRRWGCWLRYGYMKSTSEKPPGWVLGAGHGVFINITSFQQHGAMEGGREEGWGRHRGGRGAVTSHLPQRRAVLVASGTVNLGHMDLKGWFC